jgi:hypothetical protein
MACIDFRFAFDSVKHDFIWQTLKKYNLGPTLINHLQTLYHDAKSSVMNNNTRTNWFPLLHSIRQGDAVAGYIFVLVLKVLLNQIRTQIPLLTMENFSVGCIAYADDMTVFLKTAADLKRLLRIINEFAPISGLNVNLDKSEVLEMGIDASNCGLTVKTRITITGLIFSANAT